MNEDSHVTTIQRKEFMQKIAAIVSAILIAMAFVSAILIAMVLVGLT